MNKLAHRLLWPALPLIAGWTGASLLLFYLACRNYQAFHTLVEMGSVCVAWAMFLLAWNARQFLQNRYLLPLGWAYLLVGLLDLLHAMSYHGLGPFSAQNTNLATQLWISARYLQALAFVFIFWVEPRQNSLRAILLAMGLLVGLDLAAILVWDVFPVCFVEGQGLTPFKIYSEYLICGLLATGAGLVRRRREALGEKVQTYLTASLLVTIGSELAFTLYVDTYGFFNALGHFGKIASFYLVYKAVIETGLVRPYDLLFRDLVRQREALQAGEELYRAVVQDQTEMICRFSDERGILTFVNDAYCAAFGLSREKLLGRSIMDFVTHEGQAHLQEHLRSFSPPAPLKTTQHQVWARPNELRWQEWTDRAFFDAAGRLTGFQCVGRDVTAQREAEKQIADLARFPDQNPNPVLRLSADGRLLYANRASAPLLREWGCTVGGPLPAPFLRQVTAVMAAGEALKTETPCAGRFLELSWAPIPDCGYVNVYASDITERKRLEERLLSDRDRLTAEVEERTADLRELGHQLRSLIGHASVWLMAADSAGRLVLSEGSYAFPGGTEAESRIGQDIFAVMADNPPAAAAWRRALAGEEFVTELTDAEGHVFNTSFGPLRGPAGEATGALAVATDITELKQVHLELQRRQAAVEALYALATRLPRARENVCDEAAAQLAQLLDVPHVVIRHLDNGQLKTLSRYSRGVTFHHGTAELDCGPCGRVFAQVETLQFTGDLPAQFPGAPCLQDGDQRSYLGAPLKGKHGQAIGVLCAFDARERVFTAEEVHLLAVFARHVAQEIELGKMESDLRSAEQMKLLAQIAAGVAHEVRNPLNAITVTFEVLEDALRHGEPTAEYTARIRRQIDRLAKLMNDLLQFRKPVESRNLQPVALRRLLGESLELWAQAAEGLRDRVEMEFSLLAETACVNADPERLNQVFTNLLDNALQHSPPGAPIRIQVGRDGYARVLIRIADQGPGIAPDRLDQIFDPFYTTRRGGSGLGLSIVKHIIENHGGTIAVRNNEPPPGCTVELRLPLAGKETDETVGTGG